MMCRHGPKYPFELRDLHLASVLSPRYDRAELNVKSMVRNQGKAMKNASLRISLLDAQGKQLKQFVTESATS